MGFWIYMFIMGSAYTLFHDRIRQTLPQASSERHQRRFRIPYKYVHEKQGHLGFCT